MGLSGKNAQCSREIPADTKCISEYQIMYIYQMIHFPWILYRVHTQINTYIYIYKYI